MTILLIDNFDSFTFNLVQYIQECGVSVTVKRNNEITCAQIRDEQPDKIVISPGPGRPQSAGVSLDVIREFAGKIPILGVCLGHQSLAEAFGGRVIVAPKVMHGKVSQILHDGETIFCGLPTPFEATRYHSLIVERDSLPAAFEISAWTSDGLIMGIRHKIWTLEGVQFHPESVLTVEGKKLIRNFVESAEA